MIKELKAKGFTEGFNAAKEAKERGVSNATILAKVFADDKEVKNAIMRDLKVGREKAFSLAVVYSFQFDKGVAEFVYSQETT